MNSRLHNLRAHLWTALLSCLLAFGWLEPRIRNGTLDFQSPWSAYAFSLITLLAYSLFLLGPLQLAVISIAAIFRIKGLEFGKREWIALTSLLLLSVLLFSIFHHIANDGTTTSHSIFEGVKEGPNVHQAIPTLQEMLHKH